MSSSLTIRVIRGANALLTEAQTVLNKALTIQGPEAPVAFPDTVYYLPTILGLTGRPVEKIKDLRPVLRQARDMLPPESGSAAGTLGIDDTLDTGLAALIAAESLEALHLVHGP